MKILKHIVVTLLRSEARLVLSRHKPKVIAITGSVGKTSTKDAIYAAIATSVHVRKSEKSFNSDIGLPLTILGLENAWSNPLKWIANLVRGMWTALFSRGYPQWLILEVGADHPNDIRRISRWLKTDVVIITGVPEIPAHVEAFDSPDSVFKEKRELVLSLRPGGTLLLYGDDLRMRELQREFRGIALCYGMESDNDFVASRDEIEYENGKPIGVRFRMDHEGSSVPVTLRGALGRPRIYAALAALAVGKILDLDFVALSRALEKWIPPPGRLRILDGIKGSTIIDDTYNSSPAAALSALDTLQEVKSQGRKIAVLGDMLELGKWGDEAHRRVGERAAVCTDRLLTIGFRARAIGEAALDAGLPESSIREYEKDEATRAGNEIEVELQKGDLVLVKGSQGMRLERVVYELIADPLHAADSLVRMDPNWLSK
jgi:UDP-N-acetylmuramoyl-tripeptide--D-alanyl-D-alanine ligase